LFLTPAHGRNIFLIVRGRADPEAAAVDFALAGR